MALGCKPPPPAFLSLWLIFWKKYWATSIVDAAIQVLGLFFLKESMPIIPCNLDVLLITSPAYAPYLLEQKAKRIRQSIDVEKGQFLKICTVYEKNGSRT
jgi:hypothetical protein